MRQGSGLRQVPGFLLVIWLILICLNSRLLIEGRVPGRLSERTGWERVNRKIAKAVVDIAGEKVAASGMEKEPEGQRLLTWMSNLGKAAVTHSDLAELLHNAEKLSRFMDETAACEEREALLRIVEADPKLNQSGSKCSGAVLICERELYGEDLVDASTVRKIHALPIVHTETELVALQIKAGRPTLISPKDQGEYIALIQFMLEETKQKLEEIERASGQKAIGGAGVIVEAFDAPGGYLWEQIVHEQDIREIVNLLYEHGAKAVEVGGVRLGSRGWLKCAGPVVIVSGRAVAANPIVIKAVGPSRYLEESLSELQGKFAQTGKRLDTFKVQYLELKAETDKIGNKMGYGG
ncbi:MAG: DUF881 domain-containing protein [Firmicutes bacterium]|nr:DUF881 domain-containing protein [Bacillota bacterium]